MRPGFARIHLERLSANYLALRTLLAREAKELELFPVVKADAYGHGAVACAKALVTLGAKTLCVACLEEALELKEAKVNADFILLSGIFEGEEKETVNNGFMPVLSDLETAKLLNQVALREGKIARVHLKIDTGMGRLGVVPEEFAKFYSEIKSLSRLKIEGIMSHLSSANSKKPEDIEYTQKQIETFQMIHSALKQSKEDSAGIRYFHLAQSACLLRYPLSHFNSARPGLILYGANPFSPEQKGLEGFQPVMSLISKIALIRTLPSGSAISYGRLTTLKRKSRIGVVPIGYADGLPRGTKPGFGFLVRGKKAQLLGAVTMDLIMIDLTEIPEARLNDEVLIFGKEEQGIVRVEALAESANTIPYELFTRIGARVKREYISSSERLSEN